MTEIRREHVEWAIVERLRRMLEAPRHPDFNVTETFALFSSVLCWVLQHVRIGKDARQTFGDDKASELAEELKRQLVHAEPWRSRSRRASSRRSPSRRRVASMTTTRFVS